MLNPYAGVLCVPCGEYIQEGPSSLRSPFLIR
jgi:hypothetical protein